MITVNLINPNIPGNYRKARFATSNLGLSYLSSYISANQRCKVTIIDGRFHSYRPQEVFEQIQKINPQLIGISMCVDEASGWTEELIRLIRANSIQAHISLGGYFPTLLTEKVLEIFFQADSVILGEGEQTLLALVDKLEAEQNWCELKGIAYCSNGKYICNEPSRLIENLDALPFPHRYLASGSGENLEVMLEGTRGCLYRCSFCAVQPFLHKNTGKRFRIRSAESIVKEIDHLCAIYPKLQCFRFVDPDFIAPGTEDRALHFVSLMKNLPRRIHMMMDTRISAIRPNRELIKELYSVGVRRLYLGIESGSEKILKKMQKAIKVDEIVNGIQILQELGVDFSYGFMMITPWSTDEDIECNIHLLKKIGRIEFRSLFHEMTIIPGCTAYHDLSKSGSLNWCGSLSYYTYPSQTPRIDRFRKIARMLQKRHPECFGGAAGYLYESIRQFWRMSLSDQARELESNVDRLFLDVFDCCWEESSKPTTDSWNQEFIDQCYKKFYPRFFSLITQIDPSIDLSSVSKKMPPFAPSLQI
jgi:anaerobic magnesium-protoporphyrin IX monomethyl ester cyclase